MMWIIGYQNRSSLVRARGKIIQDINTLGYLPWFSIFTPPILSSSDRKIQISQTYLRTTICPPCSALHLLRHSSSPLPSLQTLFPLISASPSDLDLITCRSWTFRTLLTRRTPTMLRMMWVLLVILETFWRNWVWLSKQYYVFKNIRFAAPPTGNNRWRAPKPPATQSGIQDGTVGYQCNQALNALLSCMTISGCGSWMIFTDLNLLVAYPLLQNLEPASEDCLFLDIQVPGKAVRGEAKNLPVLFWIFGGGYVLGSKSFFL